MLKLCLSTTAIIFGATLAASEPLFPNSVVSNDLEFIATTDAGVYACYSYFGTQRQEMPGQASGGLFADGVYTFDTFYEDGTGVEVWVNPDVGDQGRAVELVEMLGPRLGKLPTFMRDRLNHVVINAGDRVAFAESEAQFFVLTDQNMAARISTHDLEETVFHETVHATLDTLLAQRPEWLAAQQADGAFITDYAAQYPDREDLAESALFAYTMLKFPGRLPIEVEDAVRNTIPARFALFQQLFSGPAFVSAGPDPDC